MCDLSKLSINRDIWHNIKKIVVRLIAKHQAFKAWNRIISIVKFPELNNEEVRKNGTHFAHKDSDAPKLSQSNKGRTLLFDWKTAFMEKNM